MSARILGLAAVSCITFALAAGQAEAQTKPDEERVELIVSDPGAETSKRTALRGFFSRVKARIAAITSHALPFTRCEKWSVRKKDLERVKQEAAKRGVVITQLGADWQQLMRFAEDAEFLGEKQKAMIERAKASKATMGVKVMVAPPPAVLENALTADAKAPPGTKEPARITVAFSDKTTITIVRTSVDIKPDMVIWRGTVEGTEDQVTLMWWANGKMTGTVQGAGRPKSIRHLGGRLYSVVEMGEDRLPQEHAAMPQRIRAEDPTLRDDPLVQQGDASRLRRRLAAAPAPLAAASKAIADQAARKAAAKAAAPSKESPST